MNPKFKEAAKVAGFSGCTPAVADMLDKYAHEIIAETINALWNSDTLRLESDEGYDIAFAIKERWGLNVQSTD